MSGGIARAAKIAGVVAGLVWAVVAGWFLHDWLGGEEAPILAERPVQVYAPETVVAGRVPNVIGLSEDEARRVFSDAGVESSAISVEEVPYVGPVGLVVGQRPPSGAPIEDGRFVLDVSTPARMPDLTGASEDEARASLSALGARITVADQYQPGAAEGTVLSTDPPAGETIGDRATLNVAEPLSSVFLTQLEPVASTCRTAEAAVIAGEAEDEAVICLPQHGTQPRAATYALGGGVESFEAELGLDDRGDPDVPVAFRVYVDGSLAFSRRVSFGERLPVEVPLLGAFQLRLEAVAAGVTEPGALPVRAAFGEPRLVGSRSAVDWVSEGLME